MADAITSTGAAAAAAASTGKTPSKGIAENFDSFLMLLTTQLKNQSPLDPLDTNQFTQQLVQFASVEQQLKSNATLSALLPMTSCGVSPVMSTASTRPEISVLTGTPWPALSSAATVIV